ncbi:MAG: hypothetical protein ISR55_07200 [Bacteroidetes bacterium]|nr:hypothetical protein [Bacteroidota bacterium]
MNKILFLIGFLSVITLQLKADGGDLFDVQEEKIQSELNELNMLEEFILQNEGVTFSQLQAENSELLENISANHSAVSTSLGINSPTGTIPAFLWGFCLGPIGVLIAYLIDEDDLMWSAIGCLVSSVLYGGGWLIFY